MFALAITIGIYSYFILFLGLFGKINYPNILSLTIIFLIICFLLFKKNVHIRDSKLLFKDKNFLYILTCLTSFVFVNLIGALGPETAFDSTWYHLTIPKLFAINERVYFIKGNLFYYSLMPKLTEMLYVSSLVLSNEITAKIVHFIFGLLTTIVVYKIGRLYANRFYSILAALIFYSNLVVAWLSITAFADLSRSFFEALTLLCFINFIQEKKVKYLVLSSILLGFSISTKSLSLLTIPIFIFLIFFIDNLNLLKKIKYSLIFLMVSILIASPWFVLAYINTGNPLYPVFSQLQIQSSSLSIFNYNILNKFSNFFITSPDPVSPIYFMMLPILLLNIRKIYKKYKFILIYAFISLVVLCITPASGGGRFVVQFLPAYSVLTAILIFMMKEKFLKKLLILIIFIIFILNLSYRVLANRKYLNVIFGITTKEEFLIENLNFSFGDFYDEGSSIKKIVNDDTVLLLGMHNLYYVDFNYTLDEWDNRKIKIKYILIHGGNLPETYRNSKFVYENQKTMVKLFKIE